MKVALLTYHYGYNEGTLLQAYAAQQLLMRAFPGAEVRIIDWRYPPKELVAFHPPRTLQEKALRDFFDERLVLSGETIRSESPDPAFSNLKKNFDLAVVGSDEVWRLDYHISRRWLLPSHRQENMWAPPFPNIYWPNAKRLGLPCVSMASSISENDGVATIPNSAKQELREALKSFSLLGVRDERTSNFIKTLCGQPAPVCEWVPDPSFALPVGELGGRQRFADRLRANGVDARQPVALIISRNNTTQLEQIVKHCKQAGFCLVSLTKSQPEMNLDFSGQDIGPFEWAEAAASAKLVVTDRFHASLFAIRNQVPVIALDPCKQFTGTDGKIRDLFKRYGLRNYWLQGYENMSVHRDWIDECINPDNWPRKNIAELTLRFQSVLTQFATQRLPEVVGGKCNC